MTEYAELLFFSYLVSISVLVIGYFVYWLWFSKDEKWDHDQEIWNKLMTWPVTIPLNVLCGLVVFVWGFTVEPIVEYRKRRIENAKSGDELDTRKYHSHPNPRLERLAALEKDREAG